MAGQTAGAKENASETQGNPSGEQPRAGLKTPSHERSAKSVSAGVAIPLCFNNLACFTYGGGFLW